VLSASAAAGSRRRAFLARPDPVLRPRVAAAAGGDEKSGSSWNAVEKGGPSEEGADFLYELGKRQDYNINIDHGQTTAHLESLFGGEFLGTKADIADGSLRYEEFRTLNNIIGEFYVAPRFMERVAMHIVKNFAASEMETEVPLALSIWGGKGQGKSFQLELTLKKMGVLPVIMSAGELEHEWAGMPGRLIRERYGRAAEMGKNQGKLTCLVINDVDAGLGRYDNTQVTVNNQIVVATIMNLCDQPAFVSLGESWEKTEAQNKKRQNRIPIFLTGNDLSKLFAPLTRDGRMDKFYWLPDRDELLSTVWFMFKDDGFTRADMDALLDAFPNQSLDFFGAIRQATYDDVVKDWLVQVTGGGTTDLNKAKDLSVLHNLLVGNKEEFDKESFKAPVITMERLMEEGKRLVQEQDYINNLRLSDEYMRKQKQTAPGSMIGFNG